MIRMDRNSNKPSIYIIMSCIMYGSVGVLLNGINGMETGAILFYRFFFGLIGVICFIIATKRYNDLYLSKKKPYMVLRGILNIICLFSYFLSMKYAGVSIAVMLLYTAPVYVTLASPLLFKERISIQSMIALLLSVVGILMLIDPSNITSVGVADNYPLGIFFGIIAGFSNASSSLTIDHLKEDYSGLSLLFWPTLMGMLILSPYAVSVSGQVLLENIWMLLQMGLLLSAVAALIYLNGAVSMKAQKASVLALLEPVSSIFFGYIILNDPLFGNTIKGCGLIMIGAFMISMGDMNFFGSRIHPRLKMRRDLYVSSWRGFPRFHFGNFRRY
ncbi:DMT family transporter [Methanococcoides methylutens]|uniref:DMT family transporter n=1 Tax=Methanococcoides methylutens TaxID=2226 RepID=UPI0009DE2711|nr:DMT family transporter [Methanococcoides methylutens]